MVEMQEQGDLRMENTILKSLFVIAFFSDILSQDSTLWYQI